MLLSGRVMTGEQLPRAGRRQPKSVLDGSRSRSEGTSMSRIPPLARSEFSQELHELTAHLSDGDLGSTRVFAHVPDLAVAWLDFLAAMRDPGPMPPRIIELVRLRVAFLNQCPRCMSLRLDPDDIDETTVCSLEAPSTLDDLTDAERTAVLFGERMATDHGAVNDEMFAQLAEHFTTPQIVELLMRTATFVGFGRLGAVLRLVDDLPDQYRAEGTLHFAT